MLEIQNLQKAYGRDFTLDIEQLFIKKGEVFGLVGNNGAGKTTLFSLILDLIRADKGKIVSNGITVNSSEDWKKHTGAYLAESFLLEFLTPEEYFDFIGDLHQWNHTDVVNFLPQFEDFFNGEIAGKRKYIRDLSKGNQKKVGIVGALIGNPEIIILDEPFANLDPSSQHRLKNLFDTLDDTGKTILISSHDITHIADVCSRIVVLENGKIVRDIEKSEDALKELRAYFEV
ncbi:MAG: ATP-binding cassette domain-containing protein [Bacteroidetes bacterium]|nr:ATP-binding cassette domain-containing protein [Bacteroidota bacterium]